MIRHMGIPDDDWWVINWYHVDQMLLPAAVRPQDQLRHQSTHFLSRILHDPRPGSEATSRVFESLPLLRGFFLLDSLGAGRALVRDGAIIVAINGRIPFRQAPGIRRLIMLRGETVLKGGERGGILRAEEPIIARCVDVCDRREPPLPLGYHVDVGIRPEIVRVQVIVHLRHDG